MMRRIFFVLFCVVLIFGWAAAPTRASAGQGTLAVAAAADLQFVLPELAARFEKESGQEVRLTFGSSGNFATQIEQGAPFDVFLSADVGYPERLVQEGLVESDSLQRYAVGQLVIYTTLDSQFDPRHGFALLLDPSVKKIAIANPQHAPYGRAAVTALERAGIYNQVAAKLVLGENISQAAEFVQTGNAQAGIVALALVRAPSMESRGKYWEIPAELYPSLEQAAVIVKGSKHTEQARAFADFLKTAETTAVLRRYGFKAPAEAKP